MQITSPYTYVHRRLDTGEIFYVGKGRGFRFKSKVGRSGYWARVVAKHGFTAEIVSFWPTDSDAYDHEIELIKSYREKGVVLCNLANGGMGAGGRVMPAEERARRSVIQAEIWKRPEFRALVMPKLAGKRVPEEAVRKASELRRGSKMSDETRAKMSQAQIRLNNLPWRKEFNCALHKGRKLSDASKAKMSIAKTGRNNPLSKRVTCVSSGEEFDSLGCAARWLMSNGFPKASASAIHRVCVGKVKRAYGLLWRFAC